MFSLKPLMSGDTTLTQMLANQLREFETISGLTTGLEIVREESATEEVGPSIQRKELLGTALFRIVQEALTNAYKHAGASQVHVRLSMTTDSYLVEISDDGCGLRQVISNGDGDHASKLQHIYSGYGLRGMRERVQELGGSLEISQSESGGVKVQANLPI
jgi:signal transduction histidine kinase